MSLSSKELGLVDLVFFIEEKLGLRLWECQRRWADSAQKAIENQDIKGLQLLAPADHGKTSRLVVPLIIWLMARNRNVRIIFCRNTEPYAFQVGRAIKQRIDNSKVLAKEYGLTRGPKWADGEFTIARPDLDDTSPTVLCIGVGTDVQSQRADYIIGDDISTMKNSRTEQQRAAISNFFFTELASRLDKTLTMKKTLVFGTRSHERDVYEENKDRPDWLYVEDRAIVDDSKQVILAPEGHTYQELSDLRSRNPTGFELMYQQRSASLGIFVAPSSMERCRRPDLHFYQGSIPTEVRSQFQYIALSLDPAFSINRWSSHAVMNLWGMKSNGTRVLLWAFRSKVTPEQLINLCEMKFRIYMPDHFLIEGNQGQILLMPVLQRTFPGHSSKFKPVFTTNKDGSILEDFNLMFSLYNQETPKVEIPYGGQIEQSYFAVMSEEFCSYPNGPKRDTLMAAYVFEKGMGLIKSEERRGYIPQNGIVGAVAASYRKPFTNPYWRKVQGAL